MATQSVCNRKRIGNVDPFKLIAKFMDRFEQQTGEYWGNYFQMLKGDFLEDEFDIQWNAVQSLINLSDENDKPFDDCVAEFLRGLPAEIERGRTFSNCADCPLASNAAHAARDR